MNQETLKATVSAIVLAVCNLALFFCGVQLDADMLMTIGMAIGVIIVTGFAAWKNHNFTEAAQVGQRVTDSIKNNAVRIEDEDE